MGKFNLDAHCHRMAAEDRRISARTPDPRGPQVDAVTGAPVIDRWELHRWRVESIKQSLTGAPWPSHSHIAPPGLVGVLVLFVWIGALNRARQIEGMTSAEQPEARVGLAQWLWLNGVRGEACWTWGQG